MLAAISCLPAIENPGCSVRTGYAAWHAIANIDLLEDIRALVEQAIVDEPPILLREGGMIRKGFNEEIDRLRDLASGGKGKIAEIEQAERERTGISKLKIGYNRVFGYYIEVSRSNAEASRLPSWRNSQCVKADACEQRALYHRGVETAHWQITAQLAQCCVRRNHDNNVCTEVFVYN